MRARLAARLQVLAEVRDRLPEGIGGGTVIAVVDALDDLELIRWECEEGGTE